MKKLLLILLSILMLFSLVACGGGSNGEDGNEGGDEVAESKYGGHLNVVTGHTCNQIDYLVSLGTWGYNYATCVWENILTRDADYNIAPGVCEYELSDDMLTLKLWVRDGAKFHNGDDVDIYDIEASLDRFLKGYGSALTYVTPYVKSYEVSEDKYLTIKFSEYREKTLYYLANNRTWLSVLPKEIYEKYGTGTISQVEDAIGTGPYKIVNYVGGVRVEVERFEDYVPCKEGHTGPAAPKMAYLDSITFWYNTEAASVTMGLLSDTYDVSNFVSEDYADMLKENNIVYVANGLDASGLYILFNAAGTNNITNKYPSLRKAIAAAIDFEELTAVYGSNMYKYGSKYTVSDKYDLDVFKQADYYGPTNLVVANKYLEEARAQGYDDEPVQLVSKDGNTMALISKYLDDAGINYNKVMMESTSFNNFIASNDNNWDFVLNSPLTGYTPGTLHDMVIKQYWANARRDQLTEDLQNTPLTDPKYMDIWKELAELMVEECPSVSLGSLISGWYHKPELHVDYQGAECYWYNTYWDNPSKHAKNY